MTLPDELNNLSEGTLVATKQWTALTSLHIIGYTDSLVFHHVNGSESRSFTGCSALYNSISFDAFPTANVELLYSNKSPMNFEIGPFFFLLTGGSSSSIATSPSSLATISWSMVSHSNEISSSSTCSMISCLLQKSRNGNSLYLGSRKVANWLLFPQLSCGICPLDLS